MDSAAFAAYLDDLLTDEAYWGGQTVEVPMGVCVATLSLLQHLVEDLQPSPVPSVLVPRVVRLNDAIGAVMPHLEG
jgi:hypothetical protein